MAAPQPQLSLAGDCWGVGMMKKILLLAALAVSLARPVAASTINFEDKIGPAHFDDALAFGQLTYVVGTTTVVFNGGSLLTGESNQTSDNTSVYATANSVPGQINVTQPGLTNPLVITFSQSILNFQIDILNAYSGNYRMADNTGHSVDFNLATTGDLLATRGFAAAGTQVTIEYLGPMPGFIPQNFQGLAWDFAIDNVKFNEDVVITPFGPAVPEPTTCALLGTGLAALIARRVRRARSA
jgi:hypothetical protein